jgi:hypothetical protein
LVRTPLATVLTSMPGIGVRTAARILLNGRVGSDLSAFRLITIRVSMGANPDAYLCDPARFDVRE